MSALQPRDEFDERRRFGKPSPFQPVVQAARIGVRSGRSFFTEFSLELVKERTCLDSQHGTDVDEFQHLKLACAALDLGHERDRLPDVFGHLSLRDSCFEPGCLKERPEPLVVHCWIRALPHCSNQGGRVGFPS